MKLKIFFLLQVIAHHPMQSISFASGGDTVSAAFCASHPPVVKRHFSRLHTGSDGFLAGFQSLD